MSDQTVLATFASTKAFASIVYSSADLTGTAYDVYVNGQLASSATSPYSVGGSLTGAAVLFGGARYAGGALGCVPSGPRRSTTVIRRALASITRRSSTPLPGNATT